VEFFPNSTNSECTAVFQISNDNPQKDNFHNLPLMLTGNGIYDAIAWCFALVIQPKGVSLLWDG